MPRLEKHLEFPILTTTISYRLLMAITYSSPRLSLRRSTRALCFVGVARPALLKVSKDVASRPITHPEGLIYRNQKATPRIDRETGSDVGGTGMLKVTILPALTDRMSADGDQ